MRGETILWTGGLAEVCDLLILAGVIIECWKYLKFLEMMTV